MNSDLKCPKAPYHKFYMGVCEHCGMTKKLHKRLTLDARKDTMRRSRQRQRKAAMAKLTA